MDAVADKPRPRPHERLRYWAFSRTKPGKEYLVDLEEFDFNGSCCCPHFIKRLEPLLKRGVTPSQAVAEKWVKLKERQRPEDALRCSHIVDAFMTFAEDAARIVQRTNERKPTCSSARLPSAAARG